MAQRKQSAGICPTCNNVKTCERRKDYRPPVIFCEEFDCLSASMQNAKAGVASGKIKNINITMGLCCNCGNTHSCKQSRAPGGIWHCEEYI